MRVSPDGFPWTDFCKIAENGHFSAADAGREHVNTWLRHNRARWRAQWLAERERIEAAPGFTGRRYATQVVERTS